MRRLPSVLILCTSRKARGGLPNPPHCAGFGNPARAFRDLLILASGLLSACAPKEITVTDVWARPGDAGGNSAVYFVVQNSTAQDDVLLRAESDVAAAVELHRTVIVDDVMKMEAQESAAIPAKGQVVFKPGDYHVMLIGLNNELRLGDLFLLTLQFKEAGEVPLRVRVKEQ